MSNAAKKSVDKKQTQGKCAYCHKEFFYLKGKGIPRIKCAPFCPDYRSAVRKKRLENYHNNKPVAVENNRVEKISSKRDATPFHFKVLFGFNAAILLVLLFIAYQSHGECTSYEFNYNLLKEVASECL